MVVKNYQPTRGHRNDFDRDHRYRARRVRAVGIDVDQMQPIETGSIFTNRTLPPLQTAGRHKRHSEPPGRQALGQHVAASRRNCPRWSDDSTARLKPNARKSQITAERACARRQREPCRPDRLR